MTELISGGQGTNGKSSVLGKDGIPLVEMLAFDGEAVVGAGNKGRPGRLTMYDKEGEQAVNLSAADGSLTLGGGGNNGTVSVRGKDGMPLVELLGRDNESVIGAGNKGRSGRLTMYDKDGEQVVNLSAGDGTLTLGGGGTNGTVSVRGKDGTPLIEMLGRDNEGVIGAGNKGRPGRLTMYDKEGEQAVNLSAADGSLTLGGGGNNGTVSVRGKDGMPLVELLGRDNESVIGLGQKNRPGRITLYNAAQAPAVELNAAQGDILLFNADFAEEFDVKTTDVQPGMVVVLAEEGGVTTSQTAYDTKVVGIVSGAGSYRPGLVLDRRDTEYERLPIALVGKVYCLVDATVNPVRTGDLLTTSDRKGHAMRAVDPHLAFGAVLGKALAPLASGCGLVPVLVSLQ